MLIFLMAIGVAGATAFYVGWQMFSGQLAAAAAKALAVDKKKSSSGILTLSRKVFSALVLPYTITWKKAAWVDLDSWRKKNKRLIVSAGLEDEIDADELFAYKVFLGFVAPIFFAIFVYVNGSGLPLWVFGGMIICGYMYPSIWVSGNRKRRHEEIKLQLPFVIDLLTLSTEAGLDFIGALQKVVEKTRPGPLVDEIGRMLQEIQLGTTRSDAMRDFAWRIDLSEIASLVAVLVTADQMGSPLGAVLRVQSELMRVQRFTSAEKKGAAASQKLLFPLIFFIMPAVFIMIFGPVILGFLGVK